MRWIEKNDWHPFDGLDVLYHRAKFGEDRNASAGCRCENVVFVRFYRQVPGMVLCMLCATQRDAHFCLTLCILQRRFVFSDFESRSLNFVFSYKSKKGDS